MHLHCSCFIHIGVFEFITSFADSDLPSLPIANKDAERVVRSFSKSRLSPIRGEACLAAPAGGNQGENLVSPAPSSSH